ncbi:MAG: gliding motility-associated C-terminal domain-containing protein [Bacteroidetes bacterium]|nr:gliding motility-associated C-terminal domain-containing protein [Bacteroidota bacterium]
MKRHLLFLLITHLFTLQIFAQVPQKETNIWHFGIWAALDFSSGTPVAIAGSRMVTREGCASICDKTTGQTLFYTDGRTVWNKNNTVMPNGTGLLGHESSTESGVIVPIPGNPNQYYLFTVAAQLGLTPFNGQIQTYSGVAYSIVDMTQNGGLGDIPIATKNVHLLDTASEKVTAVRHANGVDVWIVVHKYHSDAFYAYLATCNGIQSPVITHSGVVHTDNYPNDGTRGHMKLSPDGKRLAVNVDAPINKVELFDFNNATGVLSQPIFSDYLPPASGNEGPYGAEFSPDGSKLYVSIPKDNKIYQYDLNAGGAAAIIASKTLIQTPHVIWGLQLANDGKIYIAASPNNCFESLDAINTPNAAGLACGYQSGAVFLGVTPSVGCDYLEDSYYGLPTFIQSLMLPYTPPAHLLVSACANSYPLDAGTGWDTYLWNTTATTQSISVNSAGTYWVKKTGVNCGVVSDTIDVTLSTPFNLSMASTPAACNSNNGTATATTGAGSFTYLWSNGQTTSAATGLAAGTYTVTVSNNLCSNTSTVTVASLSGFTVPSPTSTNATCFGKNNGTATIATPTGGTPNYTYSWDTNPVQTSKTATGLNAGKHIITIRDANGCQKKDSVSITEPNAIVLTTKTDTAYCDHPVGTATVTVVSGGTGSPTYSWNSSPTQTTRTATGLTAGTYTVKVTDANGCSSQNTATVPPPVAPVTLSTTSSSSGCGTSANGSITASTSSGTAPFTYTWSQGSQTISSISNLSAGTYTVMVTDANKCTAQTTVNVAASIQPSAVFTATQNISCEGISVQFTNISTQANNYTWNFGDQTTSTELNPSHTFPASGTFVVTLIAERPPCKDTLSTGIVIGAIGSSDVGMSNIFTPNDDGKNECFTLTPDTAFMIRECLYLEVFDRWGVKVFESLGADNCWDGNNKKDNKQAANGTYFYVAKLGETTIKGYVTLVR